MSATDNQHALFVARATVALKFLEDVSAAVKVSDEKMTAQRRANDRATGDIMFSMYSALLGMTDNANNEIETYTSDDAGDDYGGAYDMAPGH